MLRICLLEGDDNEKEIGMGSSGLRVTGGAQQNPRKESVTHPKPVERATDVSLQIRFIIFNLICPQKLYELVAKRGLLVMFALSRNVTAHFFHVGLTNDERTVVPREVFQLRENVMHPAARVRLKIAQHI